MKILSLIAVSIFSFGFTSAKLYAADTNAAYKKYFGEMSEIAREVMNPEETEVQRRMQFQRLITNLEMGKELKALAKIVEFDVYLSIDRPVSPIKGKEVEAVWKKVALKALKTLDDSNLRALISRLNHHDEILQQMALINLTNELRKPAIKQRDLLKAAESVFFIDELADALQKIYDRSRSVEPAFLASMKNKSSDQTLAQKAYRDLRQVAEDLDR